MPVRVRMLRDESRRDYRDPSSPRPIRVYEGASEPLRVSIARSLVSEIEP